MTTRLSGFIVAFDRDIREDEAETLRSAISCLKSVLSVNPVETDIRDVLARQRIALQLREKLLTVLNEAIS